MDETETACTQCMDDKPIKVEDFNKEMNYCHHQCNSLVVEIMEWSLFVVIEIDF